MDFRNLYDFTLAFIFLAAFSPAYLGFNNATPEVILRFVLKIFGNLKIVLNKIVCQNMKYLRLIVRCI